MLEKLSNTLITGIKKLANSIFVDKKLIDGIIKDLQRALIESDVNIELVLKLSQEIRQIAIDEKIKEIEKKEQIITLIHQRIKQIIGEGKQLDLGKKTKVMLMGLYGSGKTTTIAKLGFYFAKRGKKVCAVGLDTQRPAAMDQLEQMCGKAEIKSFVDKKEKDPLKIWKNFEKEIEKFDLVLIDTAGRDGLNKELIKELKEIEKKTKPDYRILLMSADIGQSAKTQAQEFQKACAIQGVIITRMDGTAKAGGALTACAETNAPIFFVGTGEKIHELESFNPDSFISRLLGMGDLSALLEKVHSAVDDKQQKRIEERLKQGKFTLQDLYAQLESMNQIGSFDKLISMVPGFSQTKLSKETLEKQENKMKRWKYAIQSMTKEEIENPEVLEKQTARISRISKGSGTTTSEIRELLKQYKMMNELIKTQSSLDDIQEGKIDQKTIQKMVKKFGKKMKI
jgi:signal recognition particle subunit SRP54